MTYQPTNGELWRVLIVVTCLILAGFSFALIGEALSGTGEKETPSVHKMRHVGDPP